MTTDTTPTNETTGTPPLVLAPGVLLNDRWRMDKCLASGGYGDIWVALDDADANKKVAIKILRNDAGNNDPAALARMRQEAEILIHLDHPNIVKVFGIHQSSYGEFLVLELLDGFAMDQILISEGPASSERAIQTARQLLSALQAAHQGNVLHRDIKPENIILVPGPSGEQAKLLDFGIAKAKTSFSSDDSSGVTLVQTRAGGFMGTPRYTAPEQAVGDPVGPSADLFTLGLVLAEWLTGRMRMDGKLHQDVMTQLLNPAPVDISDTPLAWHRWLGKMLEKTSRERFQSAEEAMEAFEAWVVDFQERPAFIDDGYFQQQDTIQAKSGFAENSAPIELDLDRVRRTDSRQTNPTQPMAHATPPTRSSPMEAPAIEQSTSRWPEALFAFAIFILTCVIAFWAIKWLGGMV